MAKKLDTIGKTSIGPEENIVGLLCYSLTWVSGLVVFLIEKDSKFAKYHGLQSVILFLGLQVLTYVVSALPIIRFFGFLGPLLMAVMWIYSMIKAYQGEWIELPYISAFVRKQLNMEE